MRLLDELSVVREKMQNVQTKWTVIKEVITQTARKL